MLKRLNPWAALAGLPSIAWWLALATFINRLGSMVLPFLLLYLTRYLGWHAEQAAWILFAYGLTSVLAGPLSGYFCDRFGSGKVVCCSLVSSACVMLVFPLARSHGAILAAAVLLALCSESFRPAGLAMQTQILTPELRSRGFTLNRLAANAGVSIGPAVGGLLAAFWFPSIFLIDGISALVAAGLLYRLVWKLGKRKAPQSAGSVSAGPLKDSGMLATMAGSFLVVLGFSQLESTLPLTTVRVLGLTERDFGLIFTVNTLFIVLFEVAINTRTAGWNPSRLLLSGAILVGMGLGATAWVGNLASLLAATVVWTVGEIMFFPAQLTRVAALAPEEQMGAYLGCLTSCSGLAFAVGPAVGVPLLLALGPACFWSLIMVVCALGGVCMGRTQPPLSITSTRAC